MVRESVSIHAERRELKLIYNECALFYPLNLQHYIVIAGLSQRSRYSVS